MKLAEFKYDLPPDRIAQEPVTPRDHARLLVLDSATQTIKHHHFCELPSFLMSGDVVVLNATRVFPARLRGRKKSGGKVEALLLKGEEVMWKALIRGATRPSELVFPEGLTARMTDRTANGEWTLQFSRNGLRAYLDRHGEMPLPPYIKRPSPRPEDLDRYQTVYARQDGAVAAPTAGFHFTPALLEKIKGRGVQVLEIILHVGWGTFRPIRSERIEQHAMLPESYAVSAEAASQLAQARADGRRVMAVGTTVVRALESIGQEKGPFKAGRGETNLFIYPGYRFNAVDALVTNFHLPDSTPLLLANAFYAYKRGQTSTSTGGLPPFALRRAYEEAIREGYRFYSYGDAMLIL